MDRTQPPSRRIVIHHVIRAAVRAEMIFQSQIRMAQDDLAQFSIATVLRRPAQQFQIHHIVDDHRTLKGSVVP